MIESAAMHYHIEHDFDIDPKGYWEIFFSDEYNVDLYAQLKMKDRQVIELKDDGNVMVRAQRLTPTTNLPAIFQKVISDQTYVERNRFDRARSQMEVVIEPAMLKNKFDMRAIYAVTPLDGGRCRRSFDGDVKVSIMLLGGQIEKYMVEQLKTSYEVATRVTRDWIAKKKKA